MSSWTRTGGFVSRISVWRGLDPADRYTEPGNAPGTPHYMSPEQIRGQGFEQSDIWGFGVLAYQLLTTDSLETRVPFFGYSAADLLRRIQESDPKPPRSLNPQIPYDLETIVLKCLRKDKADRYKDGAELVLDLERFRNKEQIKARREGNLQRLKRKCRTNRIYGATEKRSRGIRIIDFLWLDVLQRPLPPPQAECRRTEGACGGSRDQDGSHGESSSDRECKSLRRSRGLRGQGLEIGVCSDADARGGTAGSCQRGPSWDRAETVSNSAPDLASIRGCQPACFQHEVRVAVAAKVQTWHRYRSPARRLSTLVRLLDRFQS